MEHVIHPLLPAAVRGRRLRRAGEPDRHVRARRPARRLRASPAARSSSTPTAAWPATAAAPSRARTRRRSTARPPTRRAGSRRTSSPPARPTRCEIQVAYAIGVAQPVSIMVETFGTETRRSGEDRRARCDEVFDLRPAAIIRDLDLRRPIYSDRGVRALRSRREGVHLGAPDPVGRHAQRAWPVARRQTPRASSSGCCPDGPIDKTFDYLVPARHRAAVAASARRCGSRCTAAGSAGGSSRSTWRRLPA